MTRFQTYQMPYGFITIDTNTEQPPEEYLDGPFNVNLDEAAEIQDGANIEIVEGEAIVTVLDKEQE